MQLVGLVSAFTGLIVWCVVVAAMVLALGGNFVCHAERAQHGIVIVACQSPVFDQP